MSTFLFKGQSLLRIELDTGMDLAGVSDPKILYLKPSGNFGEWEATVSGTKVYYDLQANDIDEDGPWSLQAKVTKDGRDGFSEIIIHRFEPALQP